MAIDAGGIAAAVSSVRVAGDLARGLMAAATVMQNAETKLRVAELITALADAKTALVDAQEEVRSLRAQVTELQRAHADRSRMQIVNGAYFIRQDNGSRAGPYCTRCFADETKLITLNHVPPTGRVLRCV